VRESCKLTGPNSLSHRLEVVGKARPSLSAPEAWGQQRSKVTQMAARLVAVLVAEVMLWLHAIQHRRRPLYNGVNGVMKLLSAISLFLSSLQMLSSFLPDILQLVDFIH
jgi:hypothetical protein